MMLCNCSIVHLYTCASLTFIGGQEHGEGRWEEEEEVKEDTRCGGRERSCRSCSGGRSHEGFNSEFGAFAVIVFLHA